ncbi:MAG: tRNA adenosine(34) deaminase TadA [bacterium]
MEQERFEYFMQQALSEAKAAFDLGEVPVGAVVVFENRIIGRGHNQTIGLHDATAHAEMLALSAAFNHFGDWRLENCTLVCTLEPCPMCAGAAMLSRIDTIIYGATDQKYGACGSIVDLPAETRFNHQPRVIGGIMEPEVAELMRLFFQQVRRDKRRVN